MSGAKKALILATLIICLFSSVAYAEEGNSEEDLKTYIIMFNEGGSKEIVEQYGTIDYEFKAINGVIAKLGSKAASLLAQESGIKLIEEDREIEIGPVAAKKDTTFEQMPASNNKELLGTQNGSFIETTGIDQWNLKEDGINAEAAWGDHNVSGAGIKIAIIDSGVNYALSGLSSGYLGGKDFCPTGTGTSCSGEDSDPMDVWGHGTEAASAMLANDTIQGIAPEAQYYALKITNDGSRTWGSILIKALDWVAAEGDADIIYMGVWGAGNQSVTQFIIDYYPKGMIFIAPTYATPKYAYPANQDKVIGVGAHSRFEPQSILPETGIWAEVVAPGENVPVLALDGSDVNAVDVVGAAAAQVVGALALMIDYNRTHNLGYDNGDLWKTLNFSAVDLWPGDSNSGWGKADVNSALTWMEQGWHVSYDINYLNPDAMDGSTPVYYLGNDVNYQLTITNNSNKDFNSLDVNSFHINLEGEHAFERINGAPEDHSTITNLSANSSQVVGPYVWTAPLETEPGEKGTEINVQIGPITQPNLGPGPMLTMVENSFILKPVPPGITLHLTQMPSYLKELAHYSGAAVAEMILDYIRGIDVNGENNDVNQTEVYEYGHQYNSPDNNGMQEFDAKAMDAVLGKYDPYDFIVTEPYDYYDSYYDGNPYQGYNYTVDSYDNILDYMEEMIHWMSWKVTQTAWFLHANDYVAYPKTPAAIPIYGSYSHWVAVNGYAVSADPTPDPYNPWTVKDFNIYGFWLTDPAQDGIGQHVYVTAAEAQATYFKPMDTNDTYDGKYLQVAEPPAMPPQQMSMNAMSASGIEGSDGQAMQDTEQAKIEIIEPKPMPENIEIIKEKIEKN